MSRTKKLSDFEVLDAAFTIIAREGFNSFTFMQVSKAVGLSPATLVKRFKNKSQFALLARNQRWEENLKHLDVIQHKELIGLEGIIKFVSLIAKSVTSHKLGEHAIFLGTEACDPKSKKKVATYFDITRKIFYRLLKESIDNGELSKTLDPLSFSRSLEALIQGAIFQFAFLDERDIENHLHDHLMVILKPYLIRTKELSS